MMRIVRRWSAVLVVGFGGIAGSGCGGSPPVAYENAVSVPLEKRADGLSYAVGASVPYTGEAVTFAKGLKRQSVQTWRDGRPHGSWLRYWPTGGLRREDKYVQGEQVLERQWFEDGTLKLECEVRNGQWFGRSNVYWPNGKLRRTSLLNRDLKPHGHALEYAEDGTVLTDAIFHHGVYFSGKLREDVLAPRTTAQAH